MSSLYPSLLSLVGDAKPAVVSTSASQLRVQLELAALQVLFLSLGMVGEAVGSALALLIPVVCALLGRPAPTPASSPSTSGSGNVFDILASRKLASQGLVHIARTYADAFKAVVAVLPDSARSTLQNAMREVLASQQQQAAQNTPAPQPMSLQKIDLAKFKK
jgi:hypothetical protein